ncbi:ATP-binding cassette domain-containing protein [Micromonospora sp. AP08]|uniref:ATP-binding cassette domain-containing protein n=1 Tax=Micromonospora sp. AP08 TaxID=2604467 RepID=UPI001652054C|nr:ATP-binding cassette domain-containing protein [Micromonospora sp. AP08]
MPASRRPDPPAAAAAVLPSRGELVFGSGSEADVLVEGPDVAAVHATLREVRGRYRLRDLGHGGGTFVRGQRILWTNLRPGDVFTIGTEDFRILPEGRVERLPVDDIDLVVADLTVRRKDAVLLDRMSFTLPARKLLAIVGPSGAGKSTLFHALLGTLPPERGTIVFRGLEIRSHSQQIRHLLGYVPQDDELHLALTVRQNLAYTAELRLPTDRTAAQRATRIDEVCRSLDIQQLLDRPCGRLSGGQRKRVSVALEVLGSPALLMLDEPTSGLDARMDHQVMVMLRAIAREGSTVLVVTHSTEQVVVADEVLAVAKGGRVAFAGPPDRMRGELGATNAKTLMDRLTDDAPELDRSYRAGPAARVAGERARQAVARAPEPVRPDRSRHVQPTLGHQVWVLFRRQLALAWARGVSRMVLPATWAALGALLAAAVSTSDGLRGVSAPQSLSLLVTLCALTGQALTYGDVVADYPVITREHRTGVAATAVIVAKWLVYALFATVQAAVITGVFLLWRPGPTSGVGLPPGAELLANLTLVSVAAMSLGLLISALASNLERAVGYATASAVAQVALNGVAFDLSTVPLLPGLAAVLPARWGLAAAASSIDLRSIAPQVPADALWTHDVTQWTGNIVVTVGLAAGYVGLACLALRRRLRHPPADSAR